MSHPMAHLEPMKPEKMPKPSKAALRQLLRNHMQECIENMAASPGTPVEVCSDAPEDPEATRPSTVYEWDAYVRQG